MAKYINCVSLINWIKTQINPYGKPTKKDVYGFGLDVIQYIENAHADVVSKKAYEQVKWERDTAIEQLNSYGVDFCEEADVVPVVRCSQCKHKCWVQEPCHGKSMDWCKLHDICIKETDYCSYGERKDAE